MTQRRRRGFLASDEGLKRLEEAMFKKGYTQEGLVAAADVSLDQVKKLLHPNWARRIQRDAIKKIAVALELKPTDIVDSSEWYPPRQTLSTEHNPLDTTDTNNQQQGPESFKIEEPASNRDNSYFIPIFHGSEHAPQAHFGKEDDPTGRTFVIGKHINTDERISLDLDRIVESCIGVFGKPTKGEFLFTKLLVSGIIRKQAAVNLIFDLHSEYGWETFKGSKGLGQLFSDQVQICLPDKSQSNPGKLSLAG